MRTGEIYKCEDEVTRLSSGCYRVPQSPVLWASWSCGPNTFTGDKHIHTESHGPLPREAARCHGLCHTPSQCHTLCYTHTDSHTVSHAVSHTLDNSVSPTQFWLSGAI